MLSAWKLTKILPKPIRSATVGNISTKKPILSIFGLGITARVAEGLLAKTHTKETRE